jgi:F-type H+-transporting ATPase subunit a
MNNGSMITNHTCKPFAGLGLKSAFWTVNTETILGTWAVLGLIIIASLYIRKCLRNENSYTRFAVLSYVQTFQDLLTQAIQSCPARHLGMIATLFTFIFLCNTIQFFPWFEEPTKDLNTTLALGLISFLYVHGTSIYTKGFRHYMKHYFEPFVFMFPLHVVGAISSIISISFRLFGNIFGGFIISTLYNRVLSGSALAQTLGLISGTNFCIFLFFGILEGIIQAFVFTMLTLTYLSMEIAQEHD